MVNPDSTISPWFPFIRKTTVQCTLCKRDIHLDREPPYCVILNNFDITKSLNQRTHFAFREYCKKIVENVCKDCVDAMHEMGFINDKI
jgi:hypothetical protein